MPSGCLIPGKALAGALNAKWQLKLENILHLDGSWLASFFLYFIWPASPSPSSRQHIRFYCYVCVCVCECVYR